MQELSHPCILAITLRSPQVFQQWSGLYGGLIHKLLQHTNLQQATTADDAMKALRHNPPPLAVLLLDNSLMWPEFGHVWYAVLAYVHEGGTAIGMGTFGSYPSHGIMESLFQKAGLGWKAAALDLTSPNVFCLNQPALAADAPALPIMHIPTHEGSCLTEVDPSEAVYFEDHSGNLDSVFHSSSRVSVAMGTVGRGKLGYMAGLPGTEESQMIILATCGIRW